jgi:hypothetical protein
LAPLEYPRKFFAIIGLASLKNILFTVNRSELKEKFFKEMKKMCYDYESKLAEYATDLERANYEIGTLRKKHSYSKKSEDLGNGNPHCNPHGNPPLMPRPKSKTNTPQGSSHNHSNSHSNSKNPPDPSLPHNIPDHILAREKEVWQTTIQQSLEKIIID